MSEDKKIVGIIGYGAMGDMWAHVLSAMPGVELAAIADPDPERQKQAGQMCERGVFPGVKEMLGFGPRIDIVIVATHAPFHFSHVMWAVERGCHVICEKPMALTLEECDMMVAAAMQYNVKLAVNHQSIFSDAVRVAEQKIVAGDIGELYAIKAYGKGRIACSDLMEIAGHLLHLMRHFAQGEATYVFGDVSINGRRVTPEDAVPVISLYPAGRQSGIGAGNRMFVYYTFSSGVRGELHLIEMDGAPDTFTEKAFESRNYGYYIELCGTAGRMQLYLPRVLFFNASPSDDLSKRTTPWVEVDPRLREQRDPILMQRLMEEFLSSIERDQEPVVSGLVARKVMEMTLGVYASHLAGQPLPLPLLNRKHPLLS